jgi:hypothetical protein
MHTPPVVPVSDTPMHGLPNMARVQRMPCLAVQRPWDQTEYRPYPGQPGYLFKAFMQALL